MFTQGVCCGGVVQVRQSFTVPQLELLLHLPDSLRGLNVMCELMGVCKQILLHRLGISLDAIACSAELRAYFCLLEISDLQVACMPSMQASY